MRTTGKLLLAFAFALPAVAQTTGQETKPTGETLWKIETSGLGG